MMISQKIIVQKNKNNPDKYTSVFDNFPFPFLILDPECNSVVIE